MTDDIHSCSYYCDRPECIKAQRDELRERLEKLTAERDAWRKLVVEHNAKCHSSYSVDTCVYGWPECKRDNSYRAIGIGPITIPPELEQL